MPGTKLQNFIGKLFMSILNIADESTSDPSSLDRETDQTSSRRKAILVLGMHRSGTSVAAGLLSHLGAQAPKDLMPADEYNETGYWESNRIYRLHDEFLQAIQSSWDDPLPIDAKFFTNAQGLALKSALKTAITEEYGDSALLCVKDPRICRFLPLWLSLLDELELEPRIVIVFRNPLEVAASLEHRNRFSLGRSEILWLRHTIDAVRYSRALPRAFVDYDKIVSDWRGAVSQIGHNLNLDWTPLRDQDAVYLEKMVSDALRHNRASDRQIEEHSRLSDWTKEIYRSLKAVSSGGDVADAEAALARVVGELDQADALYTPLILDSRVKLDETRQARGQLDRDAQNSRATLERLQATISDLSAARDSLGRQTAGLETALSEARQGSEALHERLADVTEQHARLIREHEFLTKSSQAQASRVEELETEIEVVRQSAQRDEAVRLNELEQTRADLEATRDSLAVLEERLTVFSVEHAALAQEHASLQARNFQQSQGLQALENTLVEVRGEKTALEVTISRLQKEAKDRAEEVEALQAESKAAERRFAALNARISAQNWDVGGLRTQRDTAWERIRQLENAAEDLARESERREREAAGTADELKRMHLMLQLQERMQTALMHRQAEAIAWDRDSALIVASGLFDEAYYRNRYADQIDGSTDSALRHYLEEGELYGLKPNPLFDTQYYFRRYGTELAPGEGLLVHYLRTGQEQNHVTHPLFSPSFYRRQVEVFGIATTRPLLHYLLVGRHIGLAPHPLFDPEHYERQAGPLDAEVMPIEHYLDTGAALGLDPHPLFDTKFYCACNNDVVEIDLNPLVHYIEYGDAENRLPNLLFDPRFYRAEYADVRYNADNTLIHYVMSGGTELRSTHLLFNAKHYINKNPDIDPRENNPLQHFVEAGAAEGRSPHPLFDIRYMRKNGSLPADGRHNPLAYYLTALQSRAVSTHVLFDAEYYSRRNPEVAAFPGGPLLHYLTYGWREGRDPHPLFDVVWYQSQARAEFQGEQLEPLQHYLDTWATSGCSPHRLFDAAFYLKENTDVARSGVNPLIHYLENGHAEGRDCHPLIRINYLKTQRSKLESRDLSVLQLIADPALHDVNPSPLFEIDYYLSQLAEPLETGVHPFIDYLSRPPFEAPNPHRLFDNAYYSTQIEDREAVDCSLLEHYARDGGLRKLSPHPLFDNDFYVEGFAEIPNAPLARYLENYSSFSRVQYEPNLFIHYREPNAYFDTISYLIAHPELRETGEVPLVHFVRSAPRDAIDRLIARVRKSQAQPAEEVRNVGDSSILQQVDFDRLVETLTHCKVGGQATIHGLQREGKGLQSFLASLDFASAGTLNGAAHARGIAIYAIHTSTGKLCAYHVDLLMEMRQAGYQTVVINSTLDHAARFCETAAQHANLALARSPGGRDFGSWIAALGLFYSEILEFDHCLFVNDSLVGPVAPLDLVWAAYDKDRSDFWALTQTRERIAHFQSSFFILSRKALKSSDFVRYFLNFEAPERRLDVVTHGELGFNECMLRSDLSRSTMIPYQLMIDKGAGHLARSIHDFSIFAVEPERFWGDFIPVSDIVRYARFAQSWLIKKTNDIRSGKTVNPQHVLMNSLIQDHGYPFLKKEVLIANPLFVPTLPLLSQAISPKFIDKIAIYLEEISAPSFDFVPNYLRATPQFADAVRRCQAGSAKKE